MNGNCGSVLINLPLATNWGTNRKSALQINTVVGVLSCTVSTIDGLMCIDVKIFITWHFHRYLSDPVKNAFPLYAISLLNCYSWMQLSIFSEINSFALHMMQK